MADNRGNSSGSNTNMPTGVTRSDYVDPNTLKAINAINAEYTKLIKDSFGTIKGFEDSIKKFGEIEERRIEQENKNNEKWNKALNEVAEKFGENSEEFELVLNESIKATIDMKKDYDKSLKDLKKNVIKQSFKNETEFNKLNYINSNFSKGNNLKATSNDYFSALEKLKSSALDVYGEDFMNQKEYKKALINLNDKYAKDMKEAWKEDFKENHKVLGSVADGIKNTFEKNKEVLQGFLGPLNLFIAPMKEFFGGFGLIFKGLKGGVKWLFGKFTKKNPTANDVLKSGAYGVGALWIGNKLDKILDKSKKDKVKEGLFDDFIKGSNLFSKVVGSPVFQSLATVGGLALVIKDAIAGWKKGEEWGVPNWESMVGSIVGGTGSGASGAVQGAIKYALLGASFGPWGIFAGALLGGVLGFFGGKFWAQGLDDFRKLITGKESLNSLRKRELLKDVETRKNKGTISDSDYNTFLKLSKSLSEEDFVSLGTNFGNKAKGGGRAGVIKQWLKGNLDELNENELLSFLQSQTGLGNQLNAQNLNTYKNIFSWANKNMSVQALDKIMQNEQSLASFLEYINRLQTLQIAQNQSEKDRMMYGGEYEDYFINSILGGQNSEIYKQLKSSGFFDIGEFDFKNVGNKIKNANKFSSFEINDLNWDTVDDAIIRTDGKIIKTNPKDTLVALKDVPLSMNKVRENTNKNLNGSLAQMERDGTLENKLTTIIDVLSKLLAKDVSVQLPPQTRNDLDMIMSGGMI